MYQVGDVVFYENTGACRITDISAQSVPDTAENRLYYTLSPIFQECIIRTPVDNGKVFMRPIISKEEAERLIDTIPSIQAEPFHGKANSELTEHYKELISTYDCMDLIILTMSIYAKKQEAEENKRKFGTVDERFMRRAEELLYGELSVALEIDRADVQSYISSRVSVLRENA
ncbi:MAG: CarD family transcriptional regulator [Oscillospiraceae bacterium]|jgi:CarD family transcriptional regulator|nr:CarD family transcriptional regulator [Oscillospiraceae bacterium]